MNTRKKWRRGGWKERERQQRKEFCCVDTEARFPYKIMLIRIVQDVLFYTWVNLNCLKLRLVISKIKILFSARYCIMYIFSLFSLFWKIKGGLWNRLALCLCIRLCLSICLCILPNFWGLWNHLALCLCIRLCLSICLCILPNFWGLW
jgi:hypothetical protein